MDNPTNRPLRIACNGFVQNRQSGSSLAASFLILEELLRRGLEIEFYGWKDFNDPTDLLAFENFNICYVDRNKPWLKALKSWMQTLHGQTKNIVQGFTYGLFIHRIDYEEIRQDIWEHHQSKPYDLLLFLGNYAQFKKLADVPTVAWTQGPSITNWLYIQKHKDTLISLCGQFLYFKLKIGYYLRNRSVKSQIRNSDVLICGSQWAKDQFVSLYDLSPKAVQILPYPVDMSQFKLINSQYSHKVNRDKYIFLWLGRSEPRKRLDLLLDAYKLLLEERQDVKLKIIGGFSYAEGYKKLIDEFEFPEYLEYQSCMDRSKIPELMNSCDVFIQPSEGENLGTSVAEALCCGLPVIIGSTNGTKDYIGSSSFVFEEYTPQSLKESMLKAMQAIEQDREKLSRESRLAAEVNFDLSDIVDSLEDIFRQALSFQKN